ncbi:MAG TPA: hypothetical protein VH063_07500 [Gaiellaceae bacterium]|nr:hypothetical protein [Gaiellaceae bacterium]
MSAVPLPEGWSTRLRVTQSRVILSEWTKFRSIRSTRWSMFVAFILTIGFSCIAATVTVIRWSHMSPLEQASRNPLNIAIIGAEFSQLAVGILGVLVITGEYSTGMIRASLGAVPKRLPFLWAKLIVFATVTFVLMVPAVLAAFFGSQAILRSDDILKLSFSDPGVARAVLGVALYVTGVGVLTLAIGAMIRNTAGGIAIFVAIFFVIPPLLLILPLSWYQPISEYLPSSVGGDVYAIHHGPHDLGPWSGFGVFCAYIAAAIVAAAGMLVRRDA